jgi:hypothetical protein
MLAGFLLLAGLLDVVLPAGADYADLRANVKNRYSGWASASNASCATAFAAGDDDSLQSGLLLIQEWHHQMPAIATSNVTGYQVFINASTVRLSSTLRSCRDFSLSHHDLRKDHPR